MGTIGPGAEGVEQQLPGEALSSMRGDQKWQNRLAQAEEEGIWVVLDVYSDGGADGASTPATSTVYGWLVGGTDADSLEVWAEGGARVGGLPEEMDSTRAELVGAYAVLHKVRQWRGTMRIWVGNDNVVRGLGERLGIERADAVWAVAENWVGGSQEVEPIGGCSWVWVLMVTYGGQWICCWKEWKERWRTR